QRHYVDPVDQHTVAQGVDDHSDLTTNYMNAKVEELGPWMQEDERQKAMEAERYQATLKLRKYAVAVGFFISFSLVLGIIAWQLLTNIITPENAIIVLFFILFGLGGYALITSMILKWVWGKFHTHNLRALPIVLTTFASSALLI